MNNGLKEYFPVIREREEVLDEIYQKPSLKALFETWTEKHPIHDAVSRETIRRKQ